MLLDDPGAVAVVPVVPVEVGRSEPSVASARMYDGAAAAPAGAALGADELLGACKQPVTVTESGEVLGRDCGLCVVGGGVCAAATARDAAKNAAVAIPI